MFNKVNKENFLENKPNYMFSYENSLRRKTIDKINNLKQSVFSPKRYFSPNYSKFKNNFN